jgi:hypothetical protein
MKIRFSVFAFYHFFHFGVHRNGVAAILTICDSSVWEYFQSCKIQKVFITDERKHENNCDALGCTRRHRRRLLTRFGEGVRRTRVYTGLDIPAPRTAAETAAYGAARTRCPTLPAPQPSCSTNLVHTRASIPYKRLRSPQPGRAWYRRLRSSGRPQPKQPERHRRNWTPGGVACH